jgi:hypothetical protein
MIRTASIEYFAAPRKAPVRPFQTAAVAEAFAAYPPDVRRRLLAIRELGVLTCHRRKPDHRIHREQS